MSSENAEERYKKNLKEIEDLKRYQIDYKIALDIIKNELDSIKGQENIITNIYKQRYYNKRKKLKKITALKNELILLQKETFKQEKTFKNKEAELIQNLEKLIIINEENAIKLSNNERQLYDKKIQIQEIIKENNNIKTVLRRTRTMNGWDIIIKKKLPNPPKFFIRLHQIISKKNMIVAVFLSLIDKENKGMLTRDEILKIFENSPQKIAIKYIENAIRLMGCTDKYIPLRKVEEWYEKYDYDEAEFLTSEFSDFESNTKKNEKKCSSENTRTPKSGIFEQSSINLRSLTNEELSSINQDTQEISQIFEEIATKMEILGLPKTKLAETLLETTEKKKFFSYFDLEKKMKTSRIQFSSLSFIDVLIKFIFSIKCEEISLQDIQDILCSNIRDWTVLEYDNILSIKLLIHKKMIERLPKFRNCFKKYPPGPKHSKIPWNTFKSDLLENGLSLSEESWHWWSLKFYPTYTVDFKQELKKFKDIFSVDESLRLIREKIQTHSYKLENLFDHSIDDNVSYLKFIKGIKKLNLGLRNRDIYEIIHYLISKRSSQNTNNLL